MARKTVRIDSGIGSFNSVLFLIFMTLKLCGVIDWSWWWVFAPFWIPLAILAAILAVWGLCVLGAKVLDRGKGGA